MSELYQTLLHNWRNDRFHVKILISSHYEPWIFFCCDDVTRHKVGRRNLRNIRLRITKLPNFWHYMWSIPVAEPVPVSNHVLSLFLSLTFLHSLPIPVPVPVQSLKPLLLLFLFLSLKLGSWKSGGIELFYNPPPSLILGKLK